MKSMLRMWTTALLLVAFSIAEGNANGCWPRSFGKDKIVCVCNATYCDGTPSLGPETPRPGQFYWYLSTKKGLRLHGTRAQIGSCQTNNSTTILRVNPSKRHQKIFGFGGAFTDSTGINIKKLSPATQDQLIRSYYDPQMGSRYIVGRIPIAGTDFSTRPYTYDDYPGDVTLQKFNLTIEDYDYKIPFIQQAHKLNPNVKFFASAWSAPTWMKTNDKINGAGFLKKQYYQVFADYMLKFIDAYKKHNIDVWGITTGNEPLNALNPTDKLNTMGWTPSTVATWISNNLGPTLQHSKYNDTLIMVLDDQRIQLPWYVVDMFENQTAKKYSAGIAVHWYLDAVSSPEVLDQTQHDYPDKFIMMTEACIGSRPWEQPKVDLGSWKRGEAYIASIIDYMNHWAVGWIDWNLALNKTGGPNWISNFVDAPIIVNPETDEFYKQPMYYALKHFSRFVDRGSFRIPITGSGSVKTTAFVTPTNEVVAVLFNGNNKSVNAVVQDATKGPQAEICLELPPNSMSTVIYAL